MREVRTTSHSAKMFALAGKVKGRGGQASGEQSCHFERSSPDPRTAVLPVWPLTHIKLAPRLYGLRPPPPATRGAKVPGPPGMNDALPAQFSASVMLSPGSNVHAGTVRHSRTQLAPSALPTLTAAVLPSSEIVREKMYLPGPYEPSSCVALFVLVEILIDRTWAPDVVCWLYTRIW